jgi:F0F1-type ATP synthase assembly protein I
MPENRDAKRIEPPSPEEYERLRRDAEALRQTKQSGQSDEAVRRSEIKGGTHAYIRYTGIGLQFMLMIVLPLGLGYWLDKQFGTLPWLMVAGALLGSVGGMVWVVKSVFRMEAKGDGKEKQLEK